MPCFPLIIQHDSMQCGVACLAKVGGVSFAYKK